MGDEDKTREQLLDALAALRSRVAELEQADTERRQVEEELRRSRTLLAEAERISHAGAWEWDLGSNLFTFSDEWMAIHGCHKRSMTGEELSPLAHPDDREAIAQALDNVGKGVRPYEMEHRIVRQDTGEVRVVKARGQYVLDSTSKLARVYGFSQDITEQKHVELALQAGLTRTLGRIR